jgi:hypothetical protein
MDVMGLLTGAAPAAWAKGAQGLERVGQGARAFSGGRDKRFRADQNEMRTRGAFSAKAVSAFALENAAGNLERQIRSMVGPATSCCRAFQGPNMRKCIASVMQPSLVRTWIEGFS